MVTGDQEKLTETERLVLEKLEDGARASCTEIGEVFARRPPVGTVRKPQVRARPAGRVLHRLLRAGFVTRAWIDHHPGHPREAWKISDPDRQALARTRGERRT